MKSVTLIGKRYPHSCW